MTVWEWILSAALFVAAAKWYAHAQMSYWNSSEWTEDIGVSAAAVQSTGPALSRVRPAAVAASSEPTMEPAAELVS